MKYTDFSAPLFLNQEELARRWKLSNRTLERWRYEGKGPRYRKIGGRVLYAVADIEAVEAEGAQETER